MYDVAKIRQKLLNPQAFQADFDRRVRDLVGDWCNELAEPGADPLVFILRKLAKLELADEDNEDA